MTPALISLRRLTSGVIPERRSISLARLTCSSLEASISATQVLPQSNLPLPVSPDSTARRTDSRLTPQVLQNFSSSLCAEPQRGQNIGFPSSEVLLQDTKIIVARFWEDVVELSVIRGNG